MTTMEKLGLGYDVLRAIHQHTEEVLGELLGMSAENVAALRRDGHFPLISPSSR